MRIRLESAKRIGRKIGINDDKGYAVAIVLALIIVSSVVAGYYLVLKPQPEGYNTMYLLDAQKKAVTTLINNNIVFFKEVAETLYRKGEIVAEDMLVIGKKYVPGIKMIAKKDTIYSDYDSLLEGFIARTASNK